MYQGSRWFCGICAQLAVAKIKLGNILGVSGLLSAIQCPNYENIAVKENTPEQRWLCALYMLRLKEKSIKC